MTTRINDQNLYALVDRIDPRRFWLVGWLPNLVIHEYETSADHVFENRAELSRFLEANGM